MMPLLLATAISDSIPASGHTLVPSGILTLVDAAARALLVACVVGAGLRLMAPRHVPAQKTAWGLVLAGALLMPLLAPWAGNATWLPSQATVVVPARTWSQYVLSRAAALMPAKGLLETPLAAPIAAPASGEPVRSLAGSLRSEPMDDAVTSSGRDSLQADRFPSPTISSTQTEGAETGSRPSRTSYYLPLSDVVWMIYGAVCLTLLLRLSYGLGGAIGLWQSAEPIELESEVAGGLRLRSSRKISSPVTVGSAVVLPSDYDEWDAEKLRIVLAHERSHVRQGDFYLQALAGLYAALFWFSPLGWWLKRKLSDLSEAISDRAGLEEAASHASYAQILLEFAALPRRTQVGVAMARRGRISQRIERLLNENSFRQAFAGGRRRMLPALLLVPLALFAATTLIRVEAAQITQRPAATHGPVISQTHPESAPVLAQAAAPASPAQPGPTPAEAQAPSAPPPGTPPPADVEAPASPALPSAPAPALAPRAPSAPALADDEEDADQEVTSSITENCKGHASAEARHSFFHTSGKTGYSYAYSSNGDAYALISGKDKNNVTFSGDGFNGRRADLDKARTMAHGDFLWFTRNGKSYVVDDPKTIASIQSMYKPMEELGQKQEELGKQQEALGRQQEALGERQEQASIPTPDVSKEMAELTAAIAKLEAKRGGTVSMDQLADLQDKLGELQSKLGDLEGKIGSKQGELGRQQGELGAQQGRLGAEQGKLGEQQGRIAREAEVKVKSIIDQSLKDGRARPVE